MKLFIMQTSDRVDTFHRRIAILITPLLLFLLMQTTHTVKVQLTAGESGESYLGLLSRNISASVKSSPFFRYYSEVLRRHKNPGSVRIPEDNQIWALFHSRQKRELDYDSDFESSREKREAEAEKPADTDDEHERKPKHEELTFRDTKNWTTQFPNCDPALNPYTSPVDISTKDIIRVKNTQTLIVYSNQPIPSTYIVSTMYNTDDEVRLEAFSIKLMGDEQVRDATYIAGLGTNDERFFENALFLISPPDKLGGNPHAHTINGKNSVMEIVFTFKTNLGQHSTQIHVMVELSEVENPAFFPITEAMNKLTSNIIEESCNGTEELTKSHTEMDKAFTSYKEKLSEQIKEMKGTTYAEYLMELKGLYNIVKVASEDNIDTLNNVTISEAKEKIKNCTEELKTISVQVNETEAKLAKLKEELKETIRKVKKNVTRAHKKNNTAHSHGQPAKEETEKTTGAPASAGQEGDKPKKEMFFGGISRKNKSKTWPGNDKEIKSIVGDMTGALRDNVTETLFEYRKIYNLEKKAKDCITHEKGAEKAAKKKIKDLKKLLRHNGIGNDTGDMFKSVKDITAKIDEVEKKVNEIITLQAAYEDARIKYGDIKAKQQRSAKLTRPFQISWLFPARGGHYFYNGSSPVPPCHARTHTIVMEDKITISLEQLNRFLNFPSKDQEDTTPWKSLCTDEYKSETSQQVYVEGMKKIIDQVPETTPLKKRKIWYNPRNLQFKGDDGIHLRSRLRRLKKKGGTDAMRRVIRKLIK